MTQEEMRATIDEIQGVLDLKWPRDKGRWTAESAAQWTCQCLVEVREIIERARAKLDAAAHERLMS